MDNGTKVLVVEDESAIRKFININLARNNYDVIEASSGEEAIEIFKQHSPQVVVLDVMLPGINGFEVLSQLRELKNDTVIIMLTARDQDMDKLMGLDLGADDYMVKPFNPLELVARIRAALRRFEASKPENKNTQSTGCNLKIDINAQKFYKNGIEKELTPREYSIIKYLLENPGKAVSRDELLNVVWGKNYFGDLKTLDVHIRRLREKIEDDPSDPKLILTVWGYGYRYNGG